MSDYSQTWPSPARVGWTVGVLTLTYILSFVDRTILSLLIEPIKADLRLTDTEFGLLQGMAFGLFYAAMGLPLGWLADRTSRRGLIALGVALWCAATAACGLAGTFVQLFAARIGVGIGEAALSPAAMFWGLMSVGCVLGCCCCDCWIRASCSRCSQLSR